MFDGGESAGPVPMFCGRPLAAQAHLPPQQQATCRGQAFELILLGPPDPHRKVTPLKTHCIACHAEDPLELLMNKSGERPWGTAAQLPQLLQVGAAPGLLVCECGCYRFSLMDEGTEVVTRCGQCRQRKHLGFESQGVQQQGVTKPRQMAVEQVVGADGKPTFRVKL